MNITQNQINTICFCISIALFGIGFYLGSMYETGNLQNQLIENPEIICSYTNKTPILCNNLLVPNPKFLFIGNPNFD